MKKLTIFVCALAMFGFAQSADAKGLNTGSIVGNGKASPQCVAYYELQGDGCVIQLKHPRVALKVIGRANCFRKVCEIGYCDDVTITPRTSFCPIR